MMRCSSMPLTSGTRLGPYDILAPLGAGGMGEVYRARDPRLDREVAIKVLPAALAKDPDALARFEREAMTVAKLSHPNILAIHEFGRDDGTAFVVMELVPGETLRARLERGALPSRRAVAYALQIARGIAAAHARNIVHRDLKPENVMITLDDQVKVLDFGLAKSVDPAQSDMTRGAGVGTSVGTVLGTFGYMAPEQVRGLDGRSSLGHIRLRCGALRNAQWRTSVQGGNRRRHDDGNPDEGPAGPGYGEFVHLPWSRSHRPAMSRKNARPAFSIGQRSRVCARHAFDGVDVFLGNGRKWPHRLLGNGWCGCRGRLRRRLF